jgi:hypothetical protein
MRKITLILGLLFIPYLSLAASSIGGGILADIKPTNPGPNEMVVVNLQSYSVDLDRSLITWFINNQQINSGIGQKSLSSKVGQVGESSDWSVVIETPLGQQITGHLNFNPSTVNLLWQANTYTPDWYQGKSLPSPGSQVKILALTEIKKSSNQWYKKDELVFNWYKNGKFLSLSSGVGKDNIVIETNSDYTPTQITVEVSSLDKTINSSGSLELKNYPPKLLLFPIASSTNVYPFNSSINLMDDITSLLVEPFYFSNQDILDNNLVFSWKLNNKSTTSELDMFNQFKPDLKSFSGPVNLSLEVKNKRSFFQSASYQGIIKTTLKSSLFGL